MGQTLCAPDHACMDAHFVPTERSPDTLCVTVARGANLKQPSACVFVLVWLELPQVGLG